MTSAELRCIVGRWSCECGHARETHDLDDACAECECRSWVPVIDDASTEAVTLANHATGLVALLEACETSRDWNDIDAAVAAVMAVK